MSSEEHTAATKLQSTIRGRKVRTDMESKKKAASTITRVARGRVARKRVAEKKEIKEQTEAATTIQRIARGKAARRKSSSTAEPPVHPAAQKLVDGVITELESGSVHPAAKALVDGVLDDLERCELSRTVAGAVVEDARRKSLLLKKPTPPTTSSTRGKRVSAPGRTTNRLDESQAATKVQAAARGRMARKRVRGARRSNASAAPDLGREENVAATKVQAAARGRWARKRVNEMKKTGGDKPSRIPGPKKRLGGVKSTSPMETDPSDRSSTELEPIVPRLARATAPSQDTRKPSARRRPQPGVSPRLKTHALNPISNDSSSSASASAGKKRGGHSLEIKGYIAQIEALQAKVSKLEADKATAHKLLTQHGIKLPSASSPTATASSGSSDDAGVMVTSRRGSTGTALVNVERELEALKQQNAELRKALKERDSSSTRKSSTGSTGSANRRRSTRMST